MGAQMSTYDVQSDKVTSLNLGTFRVRSTTKMISRPCDTMEDYVHIHRCIHSSETSTGEFPQTCQALHKPLCYGFGSEVYEMGLLDLGQLVKGQDVGSQKATMSAF